VEVRVTGGEHDILIREAPRVHEKKSALHLPADSLPVMHFTERKESFGYILVSGGHYFPLRRDDWLLLQKMKKCRDISEVKYTCGMKGLDLLSRLMNRGFITMKKGE
jgi:hypothetical protein